MRYANFDFLRLAAAISVIFSHSFLIAEGTQEREPFVVMTGNQTILGLLGVFVFFVISGFLVTQSFEASRSPPRFLAARLLRIFPGLAICILLCVFALGPAMTSLSLADYFADAKTWRFLADNLLLRLNDESLPGVLFTQTAAGTVVGGCFWTLPYEFECYLLVLVLGSARLLDGRIAALLLLGGLVTSAADWLGGFGWLLPVFASGMTLFYATRIARLPGALAIIALIGLLATARFGGLLQAFPLFGGYLTIYLATHQRLRLPNAARFGDLSYGLYIYGWPVEQCVAHALGEGVVWWKVFAIGLAISLALAFLSWHCVEKLALRCKPAPRAGRSSVPALAVPASVTSGTVS
ncbi:MAG: acyltransferase [Alphaproteobacteria bacterium]|nr:acyltransferase [Alphaproteobacteria bacterium]